MSTTVSQRARARRCRFTIFVHGVSLGLLLAAHPAMGQGRAYITNFNSDEITVVDVATRRVVASVPGCDAAIGVMVAPAGDVAYASCSHANTVVAIDASTLTVTGTIAVGSSPLALALTPDGTRLFVTNALSDTVSVIDTTSGTVVATVPVGNTPYDVTVTADGLWAYVANGSSDTVSVIDTATSTVVATVGVDNGPVAVIQAPDWPVMYVGNRFDHTISVIDIATRTVVDTVPSGAAMWDLAISPDGSRLYVAASELDDVLAIDPTSGALLAQVPVNNGPFGIDVTPDGSHVYVANTGAAPGRDNVSVLDAATLAVVDTITVGLSPYAKGEFISSFVPPAPPEGVDLSAATAPLSYAAEILASPAAPVSLDNGSGIANISVPVGYNFSAGETRYARVECGNGMLFEADAAAAYSIGGAASIGSINGLGSHAVRFSITAVADAVIAEGMLTITGGRSIAGTDPVDCTYGLYDFPSQAASGGIHGRVATTSGAYLEFAESTAFAATPFTSVADVESDPPFSTFVAHVPTTDGTAGLARLHYGLATPAPLDADGSPIALADLHATGADGTRIVADGDFSAAANADGSFTGEALERVYLSGNATVCSSRGHIAASALDANEASFQVGDQATDRLLCLEPLGGTPIPAADYTARLETVSAASTTYAVADPGPLDAGAILRNGAQLQAPLVQVPGDWLSRLVLTNTGGHDRDYVIAVTGESGNAIGTADLEGVVPAHGTIVIDLHDVLVSFGGERQATLEVTVASPDHQVQGMYQIVNPNTGMLSNHVLVRPATN